MTTDRRASELHAPPSRVAEFRRPPAEYLNGPYHRLVLGQAGGRPRQARLTIGDRTITGSELARTAAAFAAGLRARNLAPGDRVAMYLPNTVEAVLTFLAGSMAGAAVVPVNPSYRERELTHILRNSRARFVVAGEEQAARVELVRPDAPDLADVIVVGRTADRRSIPFADLLVSHSARGSDNGAAEPNDLALLPYSSGTTGLPKGVMLTHRNLVATFTQFASALAVHPDDLAINFLPLSHIYGLMVSGICLMAGASQVLMERFDLQEVLATVDRRRATMLFAVPPVIAALAETHLVDRYDLSSLRFINTGAASQGPETIRRAGRRTGVQIITGYGLTEAAPVSHSPLDPAKVRVETVGFPVNDTEVRIVDPISGTPLTVGEVGEVVVRGPQVMRGYWQAPDATAEALRDGWLWTGDLGTLDNDGYLSIVGRKKEAIKYKGFSIAPAEIEAVLLEHPGLADCAVIGRADDEAGEVPVAYVALRRGARVDEAELIDFAAHRLAGYKRLHAIQVVDVIPRSPAGKVLRPALKTLGQPPGSRLR